MARFLGPPEKKRKVAYDRTNLVRAFEATRSGISVYRAARQYSVPESTLRDRHLGLVSLDATIGFKTLFTKSEEEALVNHATYMADIGYGYSKSSLQHVACEYAKSLGKDVKCQESLSSNWFYGLLQRWPTLRVKKPQKLSIARAKAASREALDKYYNELNSILTENDLHNMPQNIYNIDETGVNAEHSPPKIICKENTTPQNITSTRSQLVTIIAGGNAIGNSIPPYYVYPGVRWNADFLTGACPGSAGEMSKTGWSNSFIFENYLKNHFTKFAAVSRDRSSPKTLILYDGHRSHTSLMLTDWAKENNVILFVLPPHTSHITQPLDVGVFGPFKSMYYAECQNVMQRNPGRNISKYDIAVLTHKPYLKALSAENLTASFRKTGIHPHNNKAIVDSQIAPSTIYTEISECPEEEPQIPGHVSCNNTADIPSSTGDFFQARTIVTAQKPKRKFVPPFLAGSLHKECIQDVLKSQFNKNQLITNKSKIPNKAPANPQPKPSTIGISRGGGPIPLLSEDSASGSELDFEIEEKEKCCICKRFEPELTAGCAYVSFVNWGQCDECGHWTHLKTCSTVRVLRRNDVFQCPHCEQKK